MQISGQISIGAGVTVDNVLSGTIFEILPGDGVLQFGLTSDAAVANANKVRLDVYCGLEVIAVSAAPNNRGTPPIFPDDFTLNCPSMAGDRIIVKAQNSDAAARILFYNITLDLA